MQFDRNPNRRIVLSGAAALLARATCAGAEETTKAWTVMIYVNGKNSLEPDALDNFHSMAQVGSSDQVNFVIELGRPSKRHHTGADGNWSGVYRFYLKKGMQPVPSQAAANVASLGESIDMGRPQALANFVDWSMRNYPAQQYMLVIWNHGQGWRLMLSADKTLSVRSLMAAGVTRGAAAHLASPGNPRPLGGFRAVSSDDDTGNILYNREIQDLLTTRFSKSPLDVLGFDACLMAMMETAYAFEPCARILVASEELEPGAGWRYATWMERLVAKPTMDGQELAATVVQSYRDEYRDEYLTTLSSIGLSGIRQTAGELSTFADAVRRSGAAEIRFLVDARATLSSYGSSEDPPFETSTDLISLLRRYEKRAANASLRARSQSLRERVAKHVLVNYASARSAAADTRDPYGSEGLAIYFPESKDAFFRDGFHRGYLKNNTDRPVDFVREQSWPELLYKALGIA